MPCTSESIRRFLLDATGRPMAQLRAISWRHRQVPQGDGTWVKDGTACTRHLLAGQVAVNPFGEPHGELKELTVTILHEEHARTIGATWGVENSLPTVGHDQWNQSVRSAESQIGHPQRNPRSTLFFIIIPDDLSPGIRGAPDRIPQIPTLRERMRQVEVLIYLHRSVSIDDALVVTGKRTAEVRLKDAPCMHIGISIAGLTKYGEDQVHVSFACHAHHLLGQSELPVMNPPVGPSDCSGVKPSAPPATLSICGVLMVAIQPTSGFQPAFRTAKT
ncbi:hypothetical protein GA0115255_101103 [Streptomyces sp. Ncost-T6T-2b]|nr:hypothetical protein GA0115255_101103 [Streptomyces sp. Ncost-T6T-2b]